jgi:putative pyruvate formate lyase activating enzyme
MPLAAYSVLSPLQWEEKISRAHQLATSCALCPRRCGVNRHTHERGFCNAPGHVVVSSAFPHHGEEPPLSGTRGSGTIFFSHCTLRCVFCQNFQISHQGHGTPMSVQELSATMLALEQRGCHTLNLVTPTHFLPWILEALRLAAAQGLSLPLVYNCGGYESLDALELLAGVVDIYLPDIKYSAPHHALHYSGALDYVDRNRAAIRAMFRQVGPLRLDSAGIAWRGLIVRHLVLPREIAGSTESAAWLCSTFAPEDITLSIMGQYTPLHQASSFEALCRALTPREYEMACAAFSAAELEGYVQELDRLNQSYVIDFATRTGQRLVDKEDASEA